MAEPHIPWDDGVANERNTLAWRRTSFSLIGTGAVLAKAAGSAIIAGVIFGAVVAGAALLVLHADRRQHRRHASLYAQGDVTAPVDLAVTTAIAMTLAVCGLVVIAT